MTAEILRLSEDQRDFFVPDYQVFLLGTVPPADADPESTQYPSGAVRDIVEVKYEDGLEQLDGFTLVVNNWDTERNQPIYYGHYAEQASDEHPDFFEPGHELLVSMGYKGNLNHMVLGMVTSVDVQFAENGHSKIVVSGLNVLDRLRDRQYTWSWPEDGSTGIRDSDMAESLSRPADRENNRPGFGMPVHINDAARDRETVHDHIFMNGQYPIVFLMQRARALGYHVALEEDYDDYGEPIRSIRFGPPDDAREVSYVLEWGKSLTSFHPTYANSSMIWSAKACGWDRNAKERIEVTKTIEDIPEAERPNADLIGVARAANRQEVIIDPPAQTQDEAERTAIDALKRSYQNLVTASGSCVGLPRLRSGQVIHILGVGRHFEGAYNVLTTSHVINDQGYRTSFTAHRINPVQQSGSGSTEAAT
ncbi:MAG: hypothetical protein QNJ44_11995 [Rhodobacter sp.]|nr:hypothetical protein [Rhodobacter sp.]